MVKVAIVGAGYVGKIHSEAYRQIPGAEVAAVVDADENKGRKLAGENRAKYLNGMDELMDGVDFDCADICVPTFLHHDMVIKAAAMKKHIFCEKPLSLSVDDAEEMITAVKTHGVKAMVGHVVRFGNENIKVKELLESGKLGKPLHAFCQRLASLPDWHTDGWGKDERLSGGAALDLHIHDLDLLLWLFGTPRRVKAQGINNPDTIEKGGLVHIDTCVEFESGMLGFAEGGWAFGGDFPFTKILRVLCERGTIEYSFRSGKNIENRNLDKELLVYMNDGAVEKITVESTDSFVNEIGYFIHCIDNNLEITNASFDDGKRAVELALAAIQSAKEGGSKSLT